MRVFCGVSLLLAISLGCQRRPQPQWVFSQQVAELPDSLETEVRAEVREYCGSFAEPKLLGDEAVPLQRLKHGQAVYQKRCVQCHGVSGDGKGSAAASMYPRPRDYQRGIFKFTSTPYGVKPLRSDLVRTIKRGVRGTSMPSFKLLPEQDIEAVVDYVLVLTHRGELQEQLATLADLLEEVDAEAIESETIPLVLDRWKSARQQEVHPLTPQPEFTAEHVRLGREAFLSKGCSKCHGEDGRGLTADNLQSGLKDAWGFPTRAADLTSGMLHGGQQPVDIYRRIYSGINGTPMPGFANSLREEPETLWNLVAYVLHVSNRRRNGNTPPPGPMAPYIPPDAVEAGG